MLPKLCGMDVELGNFVLGVDRPRGSGPEASQALLREMPGFPAARRYGGQSAVWTASGGYWQKPYVSRGAWYSPRYWRDEDDELRYEGESRGGDQGASSAYARQDWGRKFLANGACAYIDLDHLEIATPETLSAFDQLACIHALLRVARRAREAANAKMAPGRSVQVLVNNSDGSGNSYGSHVNFLVSRQAWDDIFQRRLQCLLYLAAFQASSIIFTGQGKVGSENGAPAVRYQISQRADFFETLVGPQTTFQRPLVNSRDEPLCGNQRRDSADAGDERARLHVIFYDSTLCHVATLLKLGTMQIVLSMIEARDIDTSLMLDDPVAAVRAWSHDPTLDARARLVDGRQLTAVEMQALFIDRAARFVDAGGCDGVVPGAREILAIWARTVDRLRRRDFGSLVGQLDWVLKQSLLERAIGQRRGLEWSAPQVKHLDHLYSSLDAAEGLYWICERSGLVERLVSDERVAWLTEHPPESTRAWTRGTLLGRAGDAVEDANWDWVRISSTTRSGWRAPRTIHLDDPLAWGLAQSAAVFEDGAELDDVLDGLEELGPARPRALVRMEGGSPWTCVNDDETTGNG